MKKSYGYTTGTCAAAAAKASLKMLVAQKKISKVSVDIPAGLSIELKIHDVEFNAEQAVCSVVKYAGKDPDVTDGAKIFCRARYINENTISVTAGAGIGVVTKKGLPVEVGLPAINPVPMKMILNEIKKLKPENIGIEVEISVPEGEEIAKKTFNAKLGVIGGISIIGTTGIVKPMSTDAVKKTIELRLKVLKEEGCDPAILTLGNYGEKFLIKNFKIPEERIILVSNFIGFSIKAAEKAGFKKIVIAGHVGKMIKVAGGVYNTHSRLSDGRLEILSSNYFLFSKDSEVAKKIISSNNVEEAIGYIKEKIFFNFIADKILKKLEELVSDLEIGVVIFSNEKGMLARTDNVNDILKQI